MYPLNHDNVDQDFPGIIEGTDHKYFLQQSVLIMFFVVA